MVGRMELVKLVVKSMMVYTMVVYKWPKKLLYKLDMFSKNFVYSGDGHKPSLTTVQWKRMCKPQIEGGTSPHILAEFDKVGFIN